MHIQDIKCFTSDLLIQQLALAFRELLPGVEAQLLMAPPSRDILLRQNRHQGPARKAAVLIPLFYQEGKLSTLLITRNVYEGVHSGQVAFPGGKAEPSDTSLIDTALREAAEEVGLEPANVLVLGSLTDVYIPPSHFMVTPVVGFLNSVPTVTPDGHEVMLVSSVALETLFDPDNRKELEINTPAGRLSTPAYCVADLVIWGATAMMISELECIWQSVRLNRP